MAFSSCRRGCCTTFPSKAEVLRPLNSRMVYSGLIVGEKKTSGVEIANTNGFIADRRAGKKASTKKTGNANE